MISAISLIENSFMVECNALFPALIWEIIAAYILLIILLMSFLYRKKVQLLTDLQKSAKELKTILIIEQDAHKETERKLDRRTSGLVKTGQLISSLRLDLQKAQQDFAEQTEELIKLQDWKRVKEKEKSEIEKEHNRQEEEQERKDVIFSTIFKYYDNFKRFPFTLLDNDSCQGTYHHVQTVAEVAGLAAERLGISSSFTRACAYFHDLGKAYHPKYFKENWGYNEEKGWRKENEDYTFYHRGQMILSHLPLGREIIEKRLKTPPTDLMELLAEFPGSNEWKEGLFTEAVEKMSSAIEEHQGNTSILGLFYASVKNGEGTTIDDFKYKTGRKPTNRVNGILLLADSCDAAFEGYNIEQDTDFGAIIKNVFFLKISLGVLDETELSIKDLGGIYEAFLEFFTNKYKTGDRIEDKKTEDRVFYLESKVNPIAESIEILQNLGEKQDNKRKVAYSFAFQADKLYKLKQVNKLINIFITDLTSLGKDDVYFTNIIKSLRRYYKLKIRDIIDILVESKIEIGELKDTDELTLADFIAIPQVVEQSKLDNRLETIFQRLVQIKRLVIEAIINKDILNKTDLYVYEEGFKTYHWLGNNNFVAEPLDMTYNYSLICKENEDNNEWVELKPGFKFIREIRGKIIEILPQFILKKHDFKMLTFNNYFKDDEGFLKDQNGFFRTIHEGYVASNSFFVPPYEVNNEIIALPINFPLSELHISLEKPKEITVCFQIHATSHENKKLLIFNHTETVKLNIEASN